MFTYDKENSDLIIACNFDDVNVQDLDAHEIFQTESTWKDRKLLYETVKVYAALTGWKPTLESRTCIKCSCFSRTKRKNCSTREYTNGSLSKDCKWQIRIKSTKNINRKILSGSSQGKFKSIPLVDDEIPVIISNSYCTHTGSCQPSTQQQIIQRERSGEYIKCISDVALFTLCTMYKEKMSLKSYYVKSILQSQFPTNHNVTKFHVFNMKKRIKKMVPMLERVSNFQDFQRVFKTTKLERGLDDAPLSDDNIAELGRDIWDELLNDSESEQCFFTFAEYMEALRQSNIGFDYQLLQDTNGRYTGCIWQTATMKDNFDMFGGFLSIDAMKRGINKLLWPYMSITMFNELNSICVACEAIICSERDESYNAMIQFVLKNSKNRTNENINVIAADGFINQDCVTNKFGLPNAIYMCDTWHLFDSILPKRFGIDTYNLIKTYLQNMCYAKTESQFEQAYEKGMEILQDKSSRDENHEQQLRKFYNERNMYASYILSKKRGTRGCHGSSISESNHSSVLVHLNEGDKHGNSYCEKPHTLVKDLFFRQKKHINQWNMQLYNESVELDVIRENIDIDYEPSLYEACSTLCLSTFKRFRNRLNDAKNYVKQVQSINCVCIQSLKHPDAPARICHRKSQNQPFTCKTCEITIAYEEQCVHSIVANDMLYIKEQFDPRHFRRERISSEYKVKDNIREIETNPNEGNEKNQTGMVDTDENSYNTQEDDYDNDHVSDFDSSDEMNIGDDVEIEADDNLTSKQKQASYYEQECYQKSKTKSLEITELRRIFNNVLSNYDTCTEKMKLVVNSISISMNEISQTDGQQCGIFRHMERENVNEEYANQQIVKLINKHKNSFLPTNGAFNTLNNNSKRTSDMAISGSDTQLRKQKIMRITSNREKFSKKNRQKSVECIKTSHILNNGTDSSYFINRKITSSCGFCGSNQSGENISNCEKRMRYRREYCEYIISREDKGNIHLINRLQNNLQISSKEYPDSTISTTAVSHRGKHVVIFNIWLKKESQLLMGPKRISDMLFEISYINKQGEVETVRCTVCGEQFESMISMMKCKRKKTFIYDATMTEGNTFLQGNSFSQNSIHSLNSTNFNLQNFSQIHFGRYTNINNSQNYSTNCTNDYSVEDGTYYSL